MRINEVIDELRSKYPGKSIILNDKHNLTEILCEIDPTSRHPDHSVAIAVIDNTFPHYHNRTTEIYEVQKGELTLTVNGKVYTLGQGQSFTVQPGETHAAKGSETWVQVTSRPGWRSDDHLKITEKGV